MSYMDRKWDFANCISYLYNAFAGLPDAIQAWWLNRY